MHILVSMLMFTIQRFCYPLLNNDGAFHRENLIAILAQPFFVIIDLIAIPFIILTELAREEVVLLGCKSTDTFSFKALSVLPVKLGRCVNSTMSSMMGEPENCIADNIVIDPRRRFWHPYLEYYMLVIQTEHGQLNNN